MINAARLLTCMVSLFSISCAGTQQDRDIVQMKRVTMPSRPTDNTYQVILGGQRASEIDRQARARVAHGKPDQFFSIRDELVRRYLEVELNAQGICRGVDLAREARNYDRSLRVEVIVHCR
jgi:hypothetical protein